MPLIKEGFSLIALLSDKFWLSEDTFICFPVKPLGWCFFCLHLGDMGVSFLRSKFGLLLSGSFWSQFFFLYFHHFKFMSDSIRQWESIFRYSLVLRKKIDLSSLNVSGCISVHHVRSYMLESGSSRKSNFEHINVPDWNHQFQYEPIVAPYPHLKDTPHWQRSAMSRTESVLATSKLNIDFCYWIVDLIWTDCGWAIMVLKRSRGSLDGELQVVKVAVNWLYGANHGVWEGAGFSGSLCVWGGVSAGCRIPLKLRERNDAEMVKCSRGDSGSCQWGGCVEGR